MKNEDEIVVNGTKYVPASTVRKRESVAKEKYVIVRTMGAGVFAGRLKSRDGKEVVLHDARRLWYWKGAASLSQMANTGPSCPTECKFPAPVDEVLLTDVVEVLAVRPAAEMVIEAVPEWKA